MPPNEHLRIGIICPYSLTLPGGVQGQVLGLARALRKIGHEVRVLGPCDGAPPDTFVTPLGDSLPTAANGSVAPIAPDPAAALRTIRVLRDEEFDVLHLHEPLSPGPTLTALMMHMAPIVATFHAAGDSASYKYLNKVVRSLAESIDHRVAVSVDARELAQRYLGEEYEILPNGVELDRFDGSSAVARERAILFLGRHEPRKGLEILLRAVRLIDDPGLQVWIASDGPETARLRREYGDDTRIEWLGRITDAEKFERLSRARVFCAPSLGGESFGVVLLEGMAAGATVVASSIDGYRNVATHELDALLVEPADDVALSNALVRVLGDDHLADALQAKGLERAREFSMENLARAYVERYRSVIASQLPADEPSTFLQLRRILGVVRHLGALLSAWLRRKLPR
jgi:phosphatidylinositol alpha-mannosyltransferase